MLFANGMVGGYPTILIPHLLKEQLDTISDINEDQISWIGSTCFITALVGCLISGFITEPIGRVRAIQIVSPLLFGAWLIFQFANEMWHIYFALSICGLISSLIEAPIISYKAEVSQPYLRGMLSATSTLSVILGVLLQFILGTFFYWRTAAIISSLFPLLTFFLLFFIPESPSWLIMHNKTETAHRNLAWLRGWTTFEDVEDEFRILCENSNLRKNQTALESGNAGSVTWKSKIDPYIRKNFLWPLSLVIFLFFLSHFTGNCTLQTYAVNIFATMQAPMDNFYATTILGVIEVIGCCISLFFVRYCGKRVMIFVTLFGVGICNVAIGTYAFIIDVKYLKFEKEIVNSSSSQYAWIPLCLFFLLAFIAHCGIRVAPWIVLGEIFTHETRAAGCGIGSASYYFFVFVANKLYLLMINGFTIFGVYQCYAAFSIVGLVVTYFALPETEGKTLDEVIDHFSGVAKLTNEVKRKKTEEAHQRNVSCTEC